MIGDTLAIWLALPPIAMGVACGTGDLVRRRKKLQRKLDWDTYGFYPPDNATIVPTRKQMETELLYTPVEAWVDAVYKAFDKADSPLTWEPTHVFDQPKPKTPAPNSTADMRAGLMDRMAAVEKQVMGNPMVLGPGMEYRPYDPAVRYKMDMIEHKLDSLYREITVVTDTSLSAKPTILSAEDLTRWHQTHKMIRELELQREVVVRGLT